MRTADEEAAGRPRRPGRSRVAMVATGVFLLVSLVAVALALSRTWAAWPGVAESTRANWHLRPAWLVCGVVSSAAALWVSGGLWGALFRSSGGRTGIPEAAAAWLGSNLGRYVPGKIWQVTGLVGYVRTRGDSGAGALATLLVFQSVMLAAGTGLGLATLGTRAFQGFGPWPIVLGALGLAVALAPPTLRFVVRLGQRLLREPGDPGPVSIRGKVLARTAVGGLIVWVLQGLGFWALLQGLVAENPVDPIVACGVFSTSYVVGYVAVIAPGGLIVREGAIVSLLSVVASISLGPAAALALAARLWATAAELLAFGAGLAIARGRSRTG